MLNLQGLGIQCEIHSADTRISNVDDSDTDENLNSRCMTIRLYMSTITLSSCRESAGRAYCRQVFLPSICVTLEGL